MAEENVARSKGVVSRFNDQKGYGFITPDEGGEDLFVHQTAIKSDGYRTLREGQVVEFTIILEGEKTKAIDVTIADGGRGDFSSRRGNSNNIRGGYGFSDRRTEGNGYGYRSGGGGGGGGGGECFNCGEYGHMARDCDRNNGGGNGGGSGGGCYTCGGFGHMARDCPSGGRMGGGNSGACFQCGEKGHLARDCVGGGSGGRQGGSGYGGGRRAGGGFGGRFGGGGGGGGGGNSCYNCGESGHFARECPNTS